MIEIVEGQSVKMEIKLHLKIKNTSSFGHSQHNLIAYHISEWNQQRVTEGHQYLLSRLITAVLLVK